MSDMEYSVVIPVYNSGEWMDELIAAIQKVMDTLDGKYEIVMVMMVVQSLIPGILCYQCVKNTSI